MIGKEYILEKVHDRFPDLLKLRFSINGTNISDFSEKILYPFMIYQNTVGTDNRLITLYLPQNSNASLLIPFFTAVGVYRRALQFVMANQNYQNESFQNQVKKVVNNADVCSIIYIDFINRILILRDGRGGEREISFDQSSYKIKWNYPAALNLYEKIEKFDKIDTLTKKDIFSFPIDPSKKHSNGVLIFTNTSKFESLLDNVKVSDNDIKAHLRIQKAIFPNNNDAVQLKNISYRSTIEKPVSIIVARTDSYRAYDKIIKAGNGTLDHINTVIFDGFDDLILKSKRAQSFDEDIEFFKENYFDKIGKNLKNVFLICSNKNFDINEMLDEKNVSSYPWLLTPLEKTSFDEMQISNPEILISRVCDLSFEKSNIKIEELILRWKDLAKDNFCGGKILAPIRYLYNIRTKLNSFFDPSHLKRNVSELMYSISQLKSEWFFNNRDYGLIDETRAFCQTIVDNQCENYKIKEVINIINNSTDYANVEIISNNNDEYDKEYLLQQLLKLNSRIELHVRNENEFYSNSTTKSNLPDLIIYLSWSREIFNYSLVNPLAERQIYLVNKRGYSFLKRYFTQIKVHLNQLTISENKYSLLNIPPVVDTNVSLNEFMEVNFVDCNLDVEKEDAKYDNYEAKEIPEIIDTVQFILSKHRKSNGKYNNTSKSFTIYFEDGTHIEWPEHRKIYFYDEDTDTDDESIQKDINELKEGDQIILAKRSRELKRVIEDSLSANKSYSRSIHQDNEWRNKILMHLKTHNWDYDFFRKKLRETGLKVDSDYTVINWISGDTITPHNYAKLLESGCHLGIFSDEKKNDYYNENKSLKSIKTKFVRNSVKKLILSIKGINYVGDDSFDESLLNSFIDHIEIKRILGIIKH